MMTLKIVWTPRISERTSGTQESVNNRHSTNKPRYIELRLQTIKGSWELPKSHLRAPRSRREKNDSERTPKEIAGWGEMPFKLDRCHVTYQVIVSQLQRHPSINVGWETVGIPFSSSKVNMEVGFPRREHGRDPAERRGSPDALVWAGGSGLQPQAKKSDPSGLCRLTCW